jgi:hypothetical protein
VPNSGFDTAFFELSNVTDISISASTIVFSLEFMSNTSAYTIRSSPGTLFTIGNGGILQGSNVTQNFVAAMDEVGNSGFHLTGGSAGDSTVFTTEGGAVAGGESGCVLLDISANAATATITNQAGSVSGASGGLTWFLFQPPTAGAAVITSEGASVTGAGEG